MIVCHCNVISRADIVSVIQTMLADDEWQLIVPLKVYHALEKRGRCCGCFPQVTDIIVATTEAWHQARATPEAHVVDLVARIREAHGAFLAARARMSALDGLKRSA